MVKDRASGRQVKYGHFRDRYQKGRITSQLDRRLSFLSGTIKVLDHTELERTNNGWSGKVVPQHSSINVETDMFDVNFTSKQCTESYRIVFSAAHCKAIL